MKRKCLIGKIFTVMSQDEMRLGNGICPDHVTGWNMSCEWNMSWPLHPIIQAPLSCSHGRLNFIITVMYKKFYQKILAIRCTCLIWILDDIMIINKIEHIYKKINLLATYNYTIWPKKRFAHFFKCNNLLMNRDILDQFVLLDV